MARTAPVTPFTLHSLASILADLRHPDEGCPWDVEQDFGSIAPYTIEEAYEVADAIARNDMADLREELGDLLLQVVYHAQIAAECSAFTLDDVIAAICEKMIRRHPHVYRVADGRTAAGQKIAWEDQKASERAGSGALDGVALALPALLRAHKLQKRAARVGFDWPDSSGPRGKILEELAEVDAAETADQRSAEIGDLLFSVVNYGRHLGVEPEEALRCANLRFERRFAAVEAAAGTGIADATIEQLDSWWSAVKAAEKADQDNMLS